MDWRTVFSVLSKHPDKTAVTERQDTTSTFGVYWRIFSFLFTLLRSRLIPSKSANWRAQRSPGLREVVPLPTHSSPPVTTSSSTQASLIRNGILSEKFTSCFNAQSGLRNSCVLKRMKGTLLFLIFSIYNLEDCWLELICLFKPLHLINLRLDVQEKQ